MSEDNAQKNIYYLQIPGEYPWLNKIITEAKRPTKIKNGWMTTKTGMPVTGIAYKTLKAQTEKRMYEFVDFYLGGYTIPGNSFIHVWIYAKDRKKDPNNLKVVDKFVCDLLQSLNIMPNDGWKNLSAGFLTNFTIDKVNPRIEIWIYENYEITLPRPEPEEITNKDRLQEHLYQPIKIRLK